MGKYGEDYAKDCAARKEPLNWLTDTDVDFCDRHEEAFKMKDGCPKCRAERSKANPGEKQ